MRTFISGLALLALLALPGAADSRVRIGKLDWYQNYDEALKVARAQAKPLWVHFGENPG